MRSRFVLSCFFFLFLFFFCGSLISGQTPMSRSNEDGAKAVIENVLHTQQEAWNRHDLEGFMAGYWNSPQLTFFSGAKEHDGWQATVERYRAAYASPGHEMGKLNSPACALKCWARMRPSCAVRGC
jgi:hypothetical protein